MVANCQKELLCAICIWQHNMICMLQCKQLGTRGFDLPQAL
jgi:hypothetical protein